MNVKSRVVVLSLSILGLAACASTEEKSSYVPPATIEQDKAYIAEVERIAQRRNIGVVWVNPPLKRTLMVRDIHD